MYYCHVYCFESPIGCSVIQFFPSPLKKGGGASNSTNGTSRKLPMSHPRILPMVRTRMSPINMVLGMVDSTGTFFNWYELYLFSDYSTFILSKRFSKIHTIWNTPSWSLWRSFGSVTPSTRVSRPLAVEFSPSG
jgi:hypothetical protein